jgi:hypothetical protein
MRTDLKKCGAHNVIHGDRETCPKCAEAARASLHARGIAKVEEHRRDRRIPVEVWKGFFAEPSQVRKPPTPAEIRSVTLQLLKEVAVPEIEPDYGFGYPDEYPYTITPA